ncbi:MAG: hypothetical protein JJD98_00325 [Polaromonas sp.]|nr:hypothetical protein [Polaromonas sp.]
MNSPCCTWACDGSKGCLGGHDQLVWPELDQPVIELDEECYQPWDSIDRLITVARWLAGFAVGASLAAWLYFSI